MTKEQLAKVEKLTAGNPAAKARIEAAAKKLMQSKGLMNKGGVVAFNQGGSSQNNYAAYRSTEGYEPQEGTQAYIDKYGQTESNNKDTSVTTDTNTTVPIAPDRPGNPFLGLQNTQEDVTQPNQTLEDMMRRNLDTDKTDVKTGVTFDSPFKGDTYTEQNIPEGFDYTPFWGNLSEEEKQEVMPNYQDYPESLVPMLLQNITDDQINNENAQEVADRLKGKVKSTMPVEEKSFTGNLDALQGDLSRARIDLSEMPKGVAPPAEGEDDLRTPKEKRDYAAYQATAKNVNDLEGQVSVAEQAVRTSSVPGASEVTAIAASDPMSLVATQDVEKIGDQSAEALDSQLIPIGTGMAGKLDPQRLLEDTIAGMAFPGGTSPRWDSSKNKFVVSTMIPGEAQQEFTAAELIQRYKPELNVNDYVTGPQVDVSTVGSAAQADDPTKTDAATYDADKVSTKVSTEVDKLNPAQLEDLTKKVVAQGMLPEDLAQLDLDPAQIDKVRTVAEIGDLVLTDEQKVKAATLANSGIPLPIAIEQVTDKKFKANPQKFGSATPEAQAAVDYDLGEIEGVKSIVDKETEIVNPQGLDLSPEQSKEITSDYQSSLEAVTGKVEKGETINPEDTYNLTPTSIASINKEKVEDPATMTDYPTAGGADTDYRSTIEGAQGSVGVDELINAEAIGINKEVVNQSVFAIAKTMEEVNEAAVMKAATLNQTTLAEDVVGTVNPMSTVQGQMSELMNQFNDGTPAWAAGAMRAATAAMSARGLGGSSMAMAAITQAAIESAIPIAQSDATFYQSMDMTNLSNRQATSLANAAASQGIELRNLDNMQAAALKNSTQAFDLQSQNLTNLQETVLANLNVKASVQNKSLDINAQASIANAARYAEMNNINLNNKQQSLLQESSENLQIELSELSNEQQAAISSLQVKASLLGQNLSNEQQMAVLESTQNFESAEFDASAKQQAFMQDAQAQAALEGKSMDIRQQTALFNASRIAEVNDVNLTNQQQVALQKSTESLSIEIENLNSRESTALANAQLRAALQGKVLDNKQQSAILNTERYAEANNISVTNAQQAVVQEYAARTTMEGKVLDNEQQAAIFNIANEIQERGVELSNEQQVELFNTTNNLEVEMANLSNKQQTALANAQIDAALRGQELSNSQQSNVLNAARVSEIANINFTTEQQTAIQNSKLAQSFDIENLNAEQALLLADAAAMTAIDMSNLDKRQQAQVQNAQNFLQLDMANLNNEQQTAIFKSQQNIGALLSDQAAENAELQFNAASKNQVNQFFADLSANVNKFNTEQKNVIAQFNAGEENAGAKFDAQLESARQQFNASNELVIEQANTKWRQDIVTLDTSAQNDANAAAATIAASITSSVLDQIWQRERDMMDYAVTSSENESDRTNAIILQKLAGEYNLDAAELRAELEADSRIGSALWDLVFS